MSDQQQNIETAVFAAGCFWGVEQAFLELPGVTETTAGYIGGRRENPTYEQVCSDATGHAEAVRILYNPDLVSYKDLLEVFWSCHNPTTLNRQGPDVGSQYRSAIFFQNAEQERLAYESKNHLNQSGKFSTPIVTEIVPAATFWPAEEYHQKYLQKRGIAHCRI
jgi:peptide-methionine (S)-S-oxide reductase